MCLRFKIHKEVANRDDSSDTDPTVDNYVHWIIALKVLSSITHWVFAVKYLEIVLNVTLILNPHQSQVKQKQKQKCNKIILWATNIFFYVWVGTWATLCEIYFNYSSEGTFRLDDF